MRHQYGTHKQDIEKLEKVQRKCLQHCSKEITIDSLDKRRTYTDFVETYKFIQKSKKPRTMFILESLLANYAVTPRKLWNSTAE